MDLYKDLALPAGHSPPPLLALHDFLGQKAPSVPYGYTHDMVTVKEEEEPAEDDGEVPSFHSEPVVWAQEEKSGRHHGDQPVTPPIILPNISSQSNASSTTTPQQQQVTRRPRPNWQTIRYQTLPGKGDKARLAEWVAGWSADIGELGQETYCACADSVTAAAPSAQTSTQPLPSPSHTTGKKRGKGGGEATLADEPETDRSSSVSSSSSSAGSTGTAPTTHTNTVCSNCSRLPSPAIVPDQDYFFSSHSGGGGLIVRCKVVFKTVMGGFMGGGKKKQQQQQQGVWARNLPAASATNMGWRHTQATPPYEGEEEEDEEEVDIDRLSRSSRAGDEIADKRARLRRAQRLLNKGVRVETEREVG